MNHKKILIKPPEARASFGPRKTGYDFAVCKKCHAFYYKKSWHHNTDKLSMNEARKLEIKSVLCPADQMIARGLYEGEILIENIPQKFFAELVQLIKKYGERAYKRDVEHRVIEISRQGTSGLRVTTTENQLAQKLAKKIQDVFNKVEVTISYSQEPYETERIRVRFRYKIK